MEEQSIVVPFHGQLNEVAACQRRLHKHEGVELGYLDRLRCFSG
jgi:hypothetical protein